MFTGTSILPAHKGAAELDPILLLFHAVMVHFQTGTTDGNAIFADGEIVFVFDVDASFFI